MTLTDFLLARIAEDAEEAFWIHHADCATNSAAAIGGFPCDCPWPKRIEVECEAQRRIVETLVLPYIAERRRLMNGQPSWGDEHPDLLRLLTLPYAEHPDYNEDWKP